MATVELLFGDVKQGERTILQIKNVSEYRVLDGRAASPNEYLLNGNGALPRELILRTI